MKIVKSNYLILQTRQLKPLSDNGLSNISTLKKNSLIKNYQKCVKVPQRAFALQLFIAKKKKKALKTSILKIIHDFQGRMAENEDTLEAGRLICKLLKEHKLSKDVGNIDLRNIQEVERQDFMLWEVNMILPNLLSIYQPTAQKTMFFTCYLLFTVIYSAQTQQIF